MSFFDSEQPDAFASLLVNLSNYCNCKFIRCASLPWALLKGVGGSHDGAVCLRLIPNLSQDLRAMADPRASGPIVFTMGANERSTEPLHHFYGAVVHTLFACVLFGRCTLADWALRQVESTRLVSLTARRSQTWFDTGITPLRVNHAARPNSELSSTGAQVASLDQELVGGMQMLRFAMPVEIC